MKIIYKNDYWDILAFMCHHSYRRVSLWLITMMFLVVTSISTSMAIPPDAVLPVKIVTFVVMEGVLVGGYLVLILGISALSMISKMNKTILTEHAITIDEGGLTEETVYNRSEYKWAGIQKVVRSGRYLYVYVAQHAAHVIPRRAFASAREWEEFVAALLRFKDGGGCVDR